jgi:hypothetical protein
MAERTVVHQLLIAAGALGVKLFRNARGIERIARKDCAYCRSNRTVSYGLANGAPDLIGWRPHVVTQADVGRTVALFVGIEAKREDGGAVSADQRAFLAALARDGAIVGVARSVADLDEILQPAKERL